MLLGGNGLVATNAHALPSGIVALLIATTPLFIVLLPILFGGEKPRAVTIAAAVVLLVTDAGRVGRTTKRDSHGA